MLVNPSYEYLDIYVG